MACRCDVILAVKHTLGKGSVAGKFSFLTDKLNFHHDILFGRLAVVHLEPWFLQLYPQSYCIKMFYEYKVFFSEKQSLLVKGLRCFSLAFFSILSILT